MVILNIWGVLLLMALGSVITLYVESRLYEKRYKRRRRR